MKKRELVKGGTPGVRFKKQRIENQRAKDSGKTALKILPKGENFGGEENWVKIHPNDTEKEV